MSEFQSLFNVEGRVAVVTGGAGLLGSEFCRTLAQTGAQVVVADTRLDEAQTLVASLQEQNLHAIAIQVNVTSPESISDMVTKTIDSFSNLDILVNCAALDPKFDPQHGGHTNSFEDYPLEAWNQAMAVNLTGVFLCCQAVAPHMVKQGKGSIINLSSIYGITAPDQRLYQRPGKAPQFKPVFYPVTKAGILSLTSYLAAYYAGKNIRINAISPGGVFDGHDDEFVQAYASRTMLGRMAYKNDMNGALLFLASDASAYMTGANLVVDGGWSAW